jgi:uncharacterized membrane protein
LSKFLSILIGLFILAAVGMLVYSVAYPVHNEKFTEFYILGINGKADDYPQEFILTGNQVSGVKYGEVYTYTDKSGRVIVGIVNREQAPTTYSLMLQVDGQPASILYAGQSLDLLADITLQPDEKWEHEIGFVPVYVGDKQKVEFLLYKEGAAEVYNSLHLWVDVAGE